MTIRNVHAMVVIPPVAGTSEDNVINNWSFQWDTTGDAGAMDSVRNSLQTFYNSLAGQLSDEYGMEDASIKFYDRADSVPRAPIGTRTFPSVVSRDAHASLPREVALCMSFQAEPASGQPQARRRGRIYLGPWAATANDDGRPSGAVIADVAAAGDQMIADDIANSAGWTWWVWSEVSSTAHHVTNGWVDDEWDTVRRRGRRPTERLTFPL